MNNGCKTVCLLLAMLASWPALAQTTVYVTDQLQIGLHAEKSLGSPILKIVASGTPLELVKTEEEVSFVREPGGTGGWIDNSYISQTSSANVLLRNAETRINSLQATLKRLQEEQSAAAAVTPGAAEEELLQVQQALDEERQRSGQLQARLETLANQAGQSENVDSLYAKIEQLSVDNNQLKQQLANILEADPGAQNPGPAPASSSLADFLSTRNLLIAIAILLGAGILVGVFLMDYINRRRHGGFRV